MRALGCGRTRTLSLSLSLSLCGALTAIASHLIRNEFAKSRHALSLFRSRCRFVEARIAGGQRPRRNREIPCYPGRACVARIASGWRGAVADDERAGEVRPRGAGAGRRRRRLHLAGCCGVSLPGVLGAARREPPPPCPAWRGGRLWRSGRARGRDRRRQGEAAERVPAAPRVPCPPARATRRDPRALR